MNGNDDPTTPGMPLPVDLVPRFIDPNPYRHERLLFVTLTVAYLMAGGVLGFALMLLAHVADQINDTPLCRRI